MLPGLPNLRPFDLSILFDHVLGDGHFLTTLTRLGFDVTVVRSTTQFSTCTKAACEKEIYLHLRDGEKMKFQCRGKSCKDTGVTLTGDETVGAILWAGMGFFPIALSAHGRIGSLFRRFLYGIDPIEPPSFAEY